MLSFKSLLATSLSLLISTRFANAVDPSAFGITWSSDGPYGLGQGNITLWPSEYGYVLTDFDTGPGLSVHFDSTSGELQMDCPYTGYTAYLIPGVYSSPLQYYLEFRNATGAASLPEGTVSSNVLKVNSQDQFITTMDQGSTGIFQNIYCGDECSGEFAIGWQNQSFQITQLWIDQHEGELFACS